MSGYFDALMRSSGITIGGPMPAISQLEPTAVEVDVDRSPAATEPRTVREASTLQEALAPVRISDPVELTVPPRLAETVDQRAHEEPDIAHLHTRGTPDPAADSAMTSPARSVETPKPDLGQTRVRAAMRWVAAGTPQVSDVAPAVPAREQPVPVVREETNVITMTKVLRDDDEAQAQPSSTTPTTVTAPNLPARERVAVQALPIRSALVTPAPPLPVAPLARDEIFEVSIGAIHVRVDAPPAQTVARPAATPLAGAPRAAGTTPGRSALSRRALRRI